MSPTRLLVLVSWWTRGQVIPPSRTERRQPVDHFTLQAVNNTSVATYGTQSLTLDLGLRRTFRWVFLITKVQHLGADFLRHFSLLVDIRYHHLRDGLTQLTMQGVKCNARSPSPAILPLKSTSVYHNILADRYPALYI